MSRIFISYRREDSAAYAGRLYDSLSQHFGADQIFMDIDTIQPGVDFVDVVEAAVGSCDAFIAVIGKHWLPVAGRDGQRRLDHPEDFVRLELATALKRNIRTIPVLVDGASMPRSDELPTPLSPLARRNALEITDGRWTFDVGRLIRTLEDVLDEHGQTRPPARLAESGAPTTTSAHDPEEPQVFPPAGSGTRGNTRRRENAGARWASQEQRRDTVGTHDIAPTTPFFETSDGLGSGRARLRWVSAAVALLLIGVLVGLQLRATTSSPSGPTPQMPPATTSSGTSAGAPTVAVGQLGGAAAPHDRPAGAFAIAIGDLVGEGVPGPGAGTIETPGSEDRYSFTAQAGQSVYFQVKAASPSTIPWKVTDELDMVVFETCLCGDAGTFKLTHGGRYTIVVGSSTDATTGTYQFRLWDVRPPDHFAIAIGDLVGEGVPGPGAGTIETPGSEDRYSFTAQAGQSVYFQVKAASPSTIPWKVTDELDMVVFETCLCGDAGTFKLTHGGRYTIVVGSPINVTTGSYSFRISAS